MQETQQLMAGENHLTYSEQPKKQFNCQSYWLTTPDLAADLLPDSAYDMALTIHQTSLADKELSCPLCPEYWCC